MSRNWLMRAVSLAALLVMLTASQVPVDSHAQSPIGDDTIPKLLADGQFVLGPNVGDFKVQTYLEEIGSQLLPYADAIEERAYYYSINPRVLLAILEMQSGLVTGESEGFLEHDPGPVDAGRLYERLDQLGQDLTGPFYQRLYAQYGVGEIVAQQTIQLKDGSSLDIAPMNINAGTYGLLLSMAPSVNSEQWNQLVSTKSDKGFAQTYRDLFPENDPLDESNQLNPLATPPSDLLKLPFKSGDTWRLTGGPHGWNGGDRPWCALDFQPSGHSGCGIPTTRWVVAAAGGSVEYHSYYYIRVNHGNGWATDYFHLANIRVSSGTIDKDEKLANPSCNACPDCGSHVHFAIVYGGARQAIAGTSLEGWIAHEGSRAYEGYLQKGSTKVYQWGSVKSTWTPTPSDTTPPAITAINPGCTAPNNQWQNDCRDPNWSWTATDSGTGVKDYQRAWGTEPNANNASWSDWTTSNSYDPGAIATATGVAQYYLHVKARDNAGNISSPATYGLWYDGSLPTVSIVINGGAATTNQANVRLDLTASDTGGVADVRISDNNLTWTAWQPYADTIPWTLPALHGQASTVYVQVRDAAGNESAVASDSITLDLYPPAPHSASYRLCDDIVDIGGSVGLASVSYSLDTAIGQPWGTGAVANASAGYQGWSGFLSRIDGCRPITYSTSAEGYNVTQWVVASGGNLRGSSSYRLGDTTGQPAAAGSTPFGSASYRLSSGFWASISGSVPPTSTSPTPITITPTPSVTPTPGPTPTPQPGGFGLSINNGALYTNDPEVTVRSWAPNITYMRLSNDGGYSDDGWWTYQLTTTWVISTYGDYVMPRYVYAWFRNAQNTYGPYFDDIIYDPVAPEGWVGILDDETTAGNSATSVTLLLGAWDDNSGVDRMRVGDDPNLVGIDWEPYTDTLTWTPADPQYPVVYAQFMDRAGNQSPIYIGELLSTDYKIYLPLVVREYP